VAFKSAPARHGGLLVVGFVIAFVVLAGLIDRSMAAQPDGPLRELWSRGNDQFIRNWLFLGPIPASAAQLDSTVTPAPGAVQALSGNLKSNWVPNVAYHDIVDLLEVFARPLSRGHMAAPEAVYAYTTIGRAEEGEAILSLASDNAVQVWVNGKLVHEQPVDRPFEYDSDQVPVRLSKGENRILLRVLRVTGPSRLALRVVESGAVLPRLTQIAPSMTSDADHLLRIKTHSREEPGPAAQVDVLAAGGKPVAHSQAQRGDVVQFDTRAWRDGAYEVRVSTLTPDGGRFISYLPWYKGDAIAAARRLLEQAPALPNGPVGLAARMLADMVRARLGNNLSTAPDDAWLSIHSPLLEYEELLQANAGEPGPVHPGGFVRLAYEDDIDGSAQFCRAYLPPDYSASRKSPVIIYLHGYNPANPVYVKWWSADQRHSAIADKHNVIYIEPHARGNAQYLGIGEGDVLRCLAEARNRLNMDDNRLYLTGESMGGSGTWILSSRHPDLFAAAAPDFGGWDLRVAPQSGYFVEPRQDYTPAERFTQEIQSSFVGAEGLLHVPLLVSHGDSDPTVAVKFSRHAVALLERWGYDIRYVEYPGRGHEDLDNADQVADWLLSHQRVISPGHVRLRSGDLAGASAYWVRVEARQEPFQLIDVDAEVAGPSLIRLDTRNVAEITLSPPPALLETKHPVEVVWNGSHQQVAFRQGSVMLKSPGASGAPAVAPAGSGARTAPGDKQPALEGGLSRLITTPFALVVGTRSPDPLMRQRCQAKADAFGELWKQWQHVTPRVFRDSEITQEEQRRYSLLLIGGPEDNEITRELASRLPLKVSREGFTLDGRKYAATDAVIQMIYPHPLAKNRYVMVVAGTSADGMYFWNPPLWHTALGFPTNYWDWTIQDGRRVKLASAAFGPERGWVAAGVFNQHWRRDDRWTYPGDAELRRGSPLRHAPMPGLSIPEQRLDSYVGTYQIVPGYAVQVTRAGQSLVVAPPGEPPMRLDPESNTEFVVHNTTDSVYFVSNDQGEVTGAVLNRSGTELPMTRLTKQP
jgi:enterochelin esterase-like enzyme